MRRTGSSSLKITSSVFFATLQMGAWQAPPAPKVGPDAVWNAPQDFIRKVHEACRDVSFPALGACFVKEMQRLGASPEAAAFADRLHGEAYLSDLQGTGNVEVAYVYYPFRANENEGCVLVNGNPALIDVDALRSLPQASMQSDGVYRSLLVEYPNLSIWPGDRGGKADPVVVKTAPDGGQRFLVHYRLRDGCHACARVGIATFEFDFDSKGQFSGAKYVETRREPS
ncbi:MAG: hypothetical protein JOY54_17230 [Acidobacteriaceae bacterium]|nr:hypothetical protein [Acidobacteriaceae bacterium]